MDKIVDINVSQTIKAVSFNVTPNLITINVNRAEGGLSSVTSVNGQTGAIILPIPSIVGLATTIYVDQQDELKVDKITGKGLSSNDYTTIERNKLDGIQSEAEVNVNADWNAITGDALILNKPIIPSIEGLATETYVNNKVSSVLRYKGTVANYESLPTIDLVIGDTWNLLDTGMNYAYTGVIGALWDALGGTVAVDGFVPYTGAIANVDLGEYQLKAGQFEFDQTPTGVFNAGMVRWNDSDGTTERKLKGGNVTLQDGQETVKRVVNKTGANLLESQYRVVRIRTAAEGGSQGQRSAIVLAQANNNLNSNATLGVVTESILNNEEGFIALLGEVRQINTTGSLQSETWLDGDQLFLSATIAGGLTKVVPASPNYSIPVATVDYAHAINGKLSVNIGRRLALDTTLSGNNDTAPSVTAVRTFANANFVHLIGNETISGLKTFTDDLTAKKLIKTGGLGSQTLRADGTVFDEYSNSVSSDVYFQNITLVPTTIGGMIATPIDAGRYKVDYNGQYNTTLANITQQGVIDYNALYLNISGMSVTNPTFPTFAAGTTVVPGVYSQPAAIVAVGTITFDAQGDPNAIFVFRTDAAFTASVGSTFNLINGANQNNIFFVGYAGVTVGASANVSGIFLYPTAAASVGTGAYVNGRLFGPGAFSLGGNVVSGGNPSIVPMGVLSTFAFFTTVGTLTNVGANIVVGDIGTNFGVITGFEIVTLSGVIYRPAQGGSLCQFSIYVNGTIVPTSTRERTNVISKEDIVISDYVNITAGQTISIKVLNSIGISRFYNRNLTVTRI